MSSLIEKWSPVTSDFGLIRAPFESVITELQSWHDSIGIQYTRTDISSSIAHAFESLVPLSHSKMRRLFVPANSDWVACFQNGIQGSDPFPAMSYLARQMSVIAMRVCLTPNIAMYPACIWEVYAPESLGGQMPLGIRRSISVVNDSGRWTFDESGERFPFERPEQYAVRRKRDRFTRQMLHEYVREFGLDLSSDDFLRVTSEAPAVRLKQVTRVWQAPEFSLEDVIAGEPWKLRSHVP